MKLKKAGALGLSCVIALGSMAGCGSSKEKEKTDGKEEISGEIRYAFWDTAQCFTGIRVNFPFFNQINVLCKGHLMDIKGM